MTYIIASQVMQGVVVLALVVDWFALGSVRRWTIAWAA